MPTTERTTNPFKLFPAQFSHASMSCVYFAPKPKSPLSQPDPQQDYAPTPTGTKATAAPAPAPPPATVLAYLFQYPDEQLIDIVLYAAGGLNKFGIA